MLDYDAIVVGAGFAGLTAARDLSHAGANVLVLEARDRIAGRTYYRPFAATGKDLEFGGTWLCPDYQPYVKENLARYGKELFKSPVPQRFAWALDSGLITSAFPIPGDQWLDAERALTRMNADAARLHFGSEPLGQAGLEDLDIPFEDYISALGLPRITHEFFVAWSGLYFAAAEPNELSALHVLSWVAGWDNSAIAAFTELTDKVVGGMPSFAKAFADDVRAEIRLSSPVASISQDGNTVTVFTRAGERITAKAAVMATPVNTWHDVEFSPALEGAHATIAEEGQSGAAIKVWILARGLKENFYAVGYDSVFKWLATEYVTDEGQYLVGFAAGAESLDHTDLAAVTAAVHELAPDAEVVAAEAHDWNADEFSQGTWMSYRPSQVMRLSAGIQQPHGRIAFAGSDLASGWAGWVDGAIETGIKAAKTVQGWIAE